MLLRLIRRLEIDKETVKYNLRGKVKEKECFRRVFVSYKACWSGFLNGCRPYLAVDATALNGRFRGQLAAACAIDGHNWLFPVAYGVLETESEESWTWFLQNLRQVIGFPDGLVIHTDACKGLEIAVEKVFPQVEHRECMRHRSLAFPNLRSRVQVSAAHTYFAHQNEWDVPGFSMLHTTQGQ